VARCHPNGLCALDVSKEHTKSIFKRPCSFQTSKTNYPVTLCLFPAEGIPQTYSGEDLETGTKHHICL